MEGIGKTTIAKCLYDRISGQFPCRYFIEDIKNIYKGKSPSYLQETFLSSILSGKKNCFLRVEAGSNEIKAKLGHQKVFVVLDGVDKAEQIHALAKETSWFGPGSRIIITTRDMGLLTSCGVNNVHEVKCLNNKDALQVFEKLAYGGRLPPSDGFEQLYIRASRLAHGLPSALVVYATHLSENATAEKWEVELSSLEKGPHKSVNHILTNSYKDLDELDRTAFLRVACFLNGYPVSHVSSLLDDGPPRINHLTAKSLISISTDGRINMHFLVVQVGRAIVCKKSGNRPSQRRFLWDHEDICDVLADNSGTDVTEGVTLHMCEMLVTLVISDGVFFNMHHLEYLKFFQHLGDIKSNVQVRPDCLKFSSNLKLLHWDVYPLTKLPYSFKHHYLVELKFRYSNLESLWDEAVNLRKLRRLDVTGSKNLIKLPDLSSAKNFEELIIEGCMRLQHIPESISRSPNFTKLNAIKCDILRGSRFTVDFGNRRTHRGSLATILRLPNEKGRLDFLTDLSIEGQIEIQLLGLHGNAEHLSFGSKQQIPDQSMTMKQETVTQRHISHSNSSKSLEIKQLSYKLLAPFHCESFENFPFLTELKLINLNIEEIAEDICHLQFLETLDLSGNDFLSLPNAMGQLPKLKHLSLQNCCKLMELPRLSQVERLTLSGCVNLRSLMGTFGVETLSGINQLLELCLENCKRLKSLADKLNRFTNLTYLDLSSFEFETIPTSISELSFIKTLCLNKCNKLRLLENLPLSLKYLYAHGCKSLKHVSFSPNHSIKHLDLSHCFNLDQEHDLLSQFINNRQNQEVTQQFACLPGTNMPGYFDNQSTGTSTRINLPPIWDVPKLVGFVACIMVSCGSSFHLQFPAFSYNWNCESSREFRINLKPNFCRSPEEDVRSHHLIIIQVPSSIDNEEIDELRFESHLRVSEELEFPPGEINSCGVRLIASENRSLDQSV